MSLKVTNEGEKTLLEWLLKSNGTNTVLHLYKNDFTPADNSGVGDFTESTFGGYSASTLTRSNWNAADTNAAGKAEIQYSNDIQWTATSEETVHGYYVTDNSGDLLFAEKFSQARALVAGDSLTISPRFTLRSEA